MHQQKKRAYCAKADHMSSVLLFVPKNVHIQHNRREQKGQSVTADFPGRLPDQRAGGYAQTYCEKPRPLPSQLFNRRGQYHNPRQTKQNGRNQQKLFSIGHDPVYRVQNQRVERQVAFSVQICLKKRFKSDALPDKSHRRQLVRPKRLAVSVHKCKNSHP